MTNLITITAYCACTTCCGPNAAGITASGVKPVEGITIAAPRRIPFGTKLSLTIPNLFTNRVFIVQDRLAVKYDDRIDVFFKHHQAAKNFGRQKGMYEVIR